jgi:hypothetical protein
MSRAEMSEFTPAKRAHTRRILWLLLAYMIILPPLLWLHAHRQIGATLWVLMAIAASIPLFGIFASWGHHLSDERDEYHQSLMLRRIATATNATVGAAIVRGFLQPFGVMPLIEAYWVPFAWVVFQGFAGCFAAFSRRSQED